MLFNVESNHPHYEGLKNIEQHVQSGAELTKQLLGFARGGRYEVKPIDLNKLIKKTSEMFGRTKKEIKIYTKYQKNIWPVEADHSQIEQVILNLCVNAWQAMPGGGDLYLQSENVSLDENHVKPLGIEPGRYVRLCITDTGAGMDEATKQRIFDPFFTTKEMGRGTGLGLASVYGIVKNHGGIIDVNSQKGEGSTFTIYIPVSDKEIVEEKGVSGETLKGTETVLLVDDEDRIVDIGKKILKLMGYKVLVARNGKEAVELYKKDQARIDIVILDMIMPEMGGGEAYDRLKEINPHVRVLLSSGYSIDGEASEILERGCNGFAQKPFSMKELSRRIREILDK
jgi:two-component system cell cycle sensor histidine kinase/response regulator CckA